MLNDLETCSNCLTEVEWDELDSHGETEWGNICDECFDDLITSKYETDV
jgi:hypothetical protein